MVRLANDRAGQVLGAEDADAFIGRDFWELVALCDASARPSQLFRQQLLEGTDFSADVKAFTGEGRKIWLSCSFSSGTLSQLDDQCPVVSVPMDLTSQPGTKAAYWFVTVQPLADASGEGAGFNGFKRPVPGLSHAHSLEAGLAGTEFADHFEPRSLRVRPLPVHAACCTLSVAQVNWWSMCPSAQLVGPPMLCGKFTVFLGLRLETDWCSYALHVAHQTYF